MQQITGYSRQLLGESVRSFSENLSWVWDNLNFEIFGKMRNGSLSALLRNQEWIYDPNANLSRIHLFAIKVLSAGKGKLYDFQENLPSLPVPTLKHSLTKYLASVRPLLSDDDYQYTVTLANKFYQTAGPQLHAKLLEYAEGKRNWLEQMWEEMAYLRTRLPLPISTNWYGTDSNLKIKNDQAGRAGRLVYLALQYRQMILNETHHPMKIGGVVPVCMDPYQRLFGTTRIPGINVDRLQTNPDSKHIVVFKNGSAYKVTVIDDNGLPLSEEELREQFKWILGKVKIGPDIGLLTTQERNQWAVDRDLLREQNKANVDCIESALLAVSFSDLRPKSLDGLSNDAFKGYEDRWFDKSLQWVIYKNGKFSANVEHTWADATIAASMHDKIFKYELNPEMVREEKRELSHPKLLKWELSGDLKRRIAAARKAIAPQLKNIDMHLLQFEFFGKGAIKELKMSPDAFIQMAIQLAYYRMYGETVLTYETASTRLFYHGRTETIRSATMASKMLCEMMDGEGIYKETKQALLRKATVQHVKNKCDSMTGKGSDRHLLALKILAQMNGLSDPFLEGKAFNLPYKLATSQTPCPSSYGGGFAPLCEDGYGVSYHVDEEHIYFHITSFHHKKETSSEKFALELERSMKHLRGLFVEEEV